MIKAEKIYLKKCHHPSLYLTPSHIKNNRLLNSVCMVFICSFKFHHDLKNELNCQQTCFTSESKIYFNTLSI